MKFLCLICAEKVMEQMPTADAEKHFQEYVKFTEWHSRRGRPVAAIFFAAVWPNQTEATQSNDPQPAHAGGS